MDDTTFLITDTLWLLPMGFPLPQVIIKAIEHLLVLVNTN